MVVISFPYPYLSSYFFKASNFDLEKDLKAVVYIIIIIIICSYSKEDLILKILGFKFSLSISFSNVFL